MQSQMEIWKFWLDNFIVRFAVQGEVKTICAEILASVSAD